MKSVLISIQPKWCELIASGKKTIEVRKTRPKIETPFKCYIYCTLDGGMKGDVLLKDGQVSKVVCGMVIGEFSCDKIYNYIADDFVGAIDFDGTIRETPVDGDFGYWIPEEKSTCMSYYDILKYGKGETLYGWHISDITIYDKPREFSEFWAYNEELHERYDSDRDFCCYDITNEYGEPLTDCGDAYNNILNCYRCWGEWSGWCHHVKRPPQSWMYVEEV